MHHAIARRQCAARTHCVINLRYYTTQRPRVITAASGASLRDTYLVRDAEHATFSARHFTTRCLVQDA
eukprot:9250161-Pyramimonas_sp.AAC.1